MIQCDLQATRLCAADLSCVVKLQGQSAVQTCMAEVAAGAACSFGVPTQCPDGEYCAGTNLPMGNFNGTCTPLPGDGEACAEDPASAGCRTGLICDTDDKCRARGRLDDPCVSNDGCLSTRCDGGKCVRPLECEP